MKKKKQIKRFNYWTLRVFFLFLTAGVLVGMGIVVYIRQANADQLGISVAAQIAPNFKISFENNTAVITTNMKVVVNGKTAK